jgi:hypothetical protein
VADNPLEGHLSAESSARESAIRLRQIASLRQGAEGDTSSTALLTS